MANINLGDIKRIVFDGDKEVTMPQGGGGVELDDTSRIAGDVVLPDHVTSIGTYAFAGCSGLTSIVIPQGVTSIGERAFAGCSGLTSITIPQGVTSIGNYTFSRCSSLTHVEIGEGITSFRNNSFIFQHCTSLESVILPDSCTSVGNNMFLNAKPGFTLSVKEGTNVSMTGMPANVNIVYRP